MTSFEEAYQGGRPPWEIGRAQPEIVRLAESGRLRGRVLDPGCGTGQNTLALAAAGLDVVGVDSAPTPIERARAEAKRRGIPVRFLVGDVLDLGALGERFDTVVDSALFHIVGDRAAYARSLAAVTDPGATAFLLEISERAVGDYPRVTGQEIREAFTTRWRVDAIEEATYDVAEGPVPAWLAVIDRTADPVL